MTRGVRYCTRRALSMEDLSKKSPSVLLKDLSKVLLDTSRALEARKKAGNVSNAQDHIDKKSGKFI